MRVLAGVPLVDATARQRFAPLRVADDADGHTREMNLTRALYRAARMSNNISALTSGDPRRIVRRAKNIAVGRTLRRASVWRRLWK